jgi:hypothetical protein
MAVVMMVVRRVGEKERHRAFSVSVVRWTCQWAVDMGGGPDPLPLPSGRASAAPPQPRPCPDWPLVVEIPPGVLGLADDAWMRYIIDLGLAGPDKGKGGKYVFLPPGYTGAVPEGYFVAQSRTYNVWFGARGFSVKGDTGPAVKAFKEQWKVYPLAQAAKPPAMAVKIVGGGSQYAVATFDGDGNYFDGGKNYRLHLPPKVPINNFWSIIPYDTQTRSVLQTDQRDTALTSNSGAVKEDSDGSIDIYFGPTAARKATGSRRCPARAGSLSCASTARWNRGSTKHGGLEKSNPYGRTTAWGQLTRACSGRRSAPPLMPRR